MGEKNEFNSNYILLQIFRQLGEESNQTMYLYDVEGHNAYFNAATARLFNIPEVVKDMPDSVMKLDFMLPESKEEFIRIHKSIEEDAIEAVGILKLRTTKGINTVYELKLSRILDDNGKRTPASVGRFMDITQRYIRDKSNQDYNKVLDGGKKFPFVYNKKKDIFKFVFTTSDLKTKEKSFFFYSRLVKEEKVCAKNDIDIFVDFLNNGSEQSMQIELFDQVTEEYRWYLINGKVNENNPDEVVGIFEDITDLKSKGNRKELLYRILNITSKDYLFIVEIDLINNHYEALFGDFKRIGFYYPENGEYLSANEFLADKVDDKFKKRRIEFGKIEFIKEELKDKEKLVLDFKTLNEKYPWRRAIIQKSECDEVGNPTKVVLSHIVIDEDELARAPISLETEDNDAITKILIVEDYELNAKLAIENAKLVGMEADWASTREEALSMLTKPAASYKMILMDDKLKGVSGYEMSREIRDMEITTPIVLNSLHDSKDIDDKCKEAGITSHVGKPLVAKQLNYLKNKYIQ